MRAFVAIDLPDSLRAALREKQKSFRAACPEARWTRPEGIHLTLKFLGEISAAQVKQVSDALAALGPVETFEIAVRGFGFFPDARRARVFWAGLEAPAALSELAARVEAALEPLGFPREHRSFTPHLTLARFNTPRPQPALQKLLEDALGAVPDKMGTGHEPPPSGESEPSPSAVGKPPLLGRFTVSEFFLFESKLSPHGAQYTKVARFPR